MEYPRANTAVIANTRFMLDLLSRWPEQQQKNTDIRENWDTFQMKTKFKKWVPDIYWIFKQRQQWKQKETKQPPYQKPVPGWWHWAQWPAERSVWFPKAPRKTTKVRTLHPRQEKNQNQTTLFNHLHRKWLLFFFPLSLHSAKTI